MPRDKYKWTHERLSLFHRLYKNGLTDVHAGEEIGCHKSVVRYKREGLGLPANGPRRRHGYNSETKEPRQSPKYEPDQRDLTGVFFGDPQPSRSALAQRGRVAPPKISLASAGMLTAVDGTKRNAQFAATQADRYARGTLNGGGISNAIRARQARREREARA